MAYEIEVKDLDAQPVVTVRTTTRPEQVAATLGELLPEVWTYVFSQDARPAGPPFTRYHRYEADAVELEAGVPVSAPVASAGRIAAGTLPAGPAAITWHAGPYDTLSNAYEAVEAWLAAGGRRPGGAPWEIYWSDPGAEPDPAKWHTELVWPLA